MLLQVANLNVHYGRLWILRDVGLQVDEGEIVGMVGPNGAGKTTLAYTVARLVEASSGEIRFDGHDIGCLPAHQIPERGIALVPEGRRIFPSLTVLENLEIGAYCRRARAKKGETLEKVFQLFPVLRERINQAAGTLSGGEQQMLAIGRGLMSLPQLLILDEPSTGLGAIVIDVVYEVLKRVCLESRVGILLIEQNIQKALNLADRAYVLENGSVVLSGQGKEVLADERLRRAYLSLA